MDIKDSLKAAGRAIKNSPKIVKKKFAEVKGKQKLREEWFSSSDAIVAGITFYVKYLGTVKVEHAQGQGFTDEAVSRIVAHAKARKSVGQKLTKMALTVSSKSLALVDINTANKLDEIPMYRISYCTIDGRNKRVFSYISRNQSTSSLEVHSFLCSKPSKAQAMTLSVAQAFNIAFETWQEAKARRKAQMDALKRQQEMKEAQGAVSTSTAAAAASTAAPMLQAPSGSTAAQPVEGDLVDIGPSQVAATPLDDEQVEDLADKMADWDMDNDLDAEFSRLAEHRTNPQMLEFGGVGEDCNQEEILKFQQGDSNPDDLDRTPSQDDLLDF